MQPAESGNFSKFKFKDFIIRNRGNALVAVGVYFAALWFNENVAGFVSIAGGSMRPTLNPASHSKSRDLCLLWRWQYQPSKGDVVCLVPPQANSLAVKRVIALEGEVVKPRSTNFTSDLFIVIPSGHVWVEGDNADISQDSNSYGPVPSGMIVGHVTRIVVPQTKSNFLRYFNKVVSMIPDSSFSTL